MIFKNRIEAAELLAKQLKPFADADTVVLAIPRGGVPLGKIIAEELGVDLDVVLIKKISHPHNSEYAIGSVSLTNETIAHTKIPRSYIDDQIRKLRSIMKEKYKMYRAQINPVPLKGKKVILVDDGIATGKSIISAVKLLRNQGVHSIVLGVPVASPHALKEIKPLVDQLICLQAPTNFRAVSRFYQDFNQVSDREVAALLKSVSTSKPSNTSYGR